MTGSILDDRPTDLASLLAILAAAGSLLVVYEAPGQRRSIGIVVLGILLVLTASRWASDGTLRARGGVAGGLAVVVLGFDHALSTPLTTLQAAELGPGLFGVAVLGFALWPVRRSWAVTLATAGAGLVLGGVLLTGVSHTAGRTELLVGTAGSVVAWDAARQGITLGRQVGRQAVTRAVTLRHVGATAIAGGVFVALAEAVWRLGVTGPSLPGLVVFLGAAVALLVGLYGRPAVAESAEAGE